MLNDAVCFKNVYIVTGYTDLRFGIDSLAALIKSKLGEGATCSGYFIPVLWQANGSNQRIGLGIRWISAFIQKVGTRELSVAAIRIRSSKSLPATVSVVNGRSYCHSEKDCQTSRTARIHGINLCKKEKFNQ